MRWNTRQSGEPSAQDALRFLLTPVSVQEGKPGCSASIPSLSHQPTGESAFRKHYFSHKPPPRCPRNLEPNVIRVLHKSKGKCRNFKKGHPHLLRKTRTQELKMMLLSVHHTWRRGLRRLASSWSLRPMILYILKN